MWRRGLKSIFGKTGVRGRRRRSNFASLTPLTYGGHANEPTVLDVFDQILELLRERRLESVTLDEMFGTSRAVG
jgi:hypothetical protein